MPHSILSDGTYVLTEPVRLPKVLDLLIVGGGPAGTAAAFRAKELGLSALVVDYDDLMKRIRDYAKDKLILPHFGGGDKMKFPKCGDVLNQLHFGPIDKDDMCAAWKGYYRAGSIPAQIGIELTGLEWQNDSVWEVQAWNHRMKAEQRYLARHVALAIGRGVPRRFDIPGNTDGIAYRLSDPSKYVGAPALVIGGGTSAAEAVIAISSAKTEAEDPSRIYWSYRGDKMPKVSRALSEEFFDAYVGNGNILYHPRSEPVAVVTASDRQEYLSLRIDRKEIEGRPSETAHLEFPKTQCLACIGEDIPEKFLNTLGIFMVTGGPNNKKRMTVTPLLESHQPNLYLIGDILSQAYLETEDFDADPATFREVKHRGNIKSALRDGVFVAEVVRQKIDGNEEIQVALEFAEEEPVGSVVAPSKTGSDSFMRLFIDTEGPPKASILDERAVTEEHGTLVRMTYAGVDEDEYTLGANGATTIGREKCDISFPDDTMLSPHHASVSHNADGYFLRDDGSDTGTYLRLRPGQSMPLTSGDLLRLGRQILLFQVDKDGSSFTQYDHTGAQINQVTLTEKTIVMGRKAPDVILDAEDKMLSRRHLAVSMKNGTLYVKDLKSLNGTYLRVRNAVEIDHDDIFRAGQQIFRLSLREEAPRASTAFKVKPPSLVRPAMLATPPSAGEPMVTFKGHGQPLALKPGQTFCDAAEEHNIDLNAECHSGICGSDPVRILSGSEYLSPLSDEEADTLEDLCGLKPGECRLACMVKATGPVTVEVVET